MALSPPPFSLIFGSCFFMDTKLGIRAESEKQTVADRSQLSALLGVVVLAGLDMHLLNLALDHPHPRALSLFMEDFSWNPPSEVQAPPRERRRACMRSCMRAFSARARLRACPRHFAVLQDGDRRPVSGLRVVRNLTQRCVLFCFCFCCGGGGAGGGGTKQGRRHPHTSRLAWKAS